jgi:2-polyprenyl-3-methyl-5-hydroxy-6-metoxy-1,4-benzoquinol methylase
MNCLNNIYLWRIKMKVDRELQELYDACYTTGSIEEDREITSRQTLEHIKIITGNKKLKKIIDIGAGNGSLIQAISELDICESISAVEISSSGVEVIQKKNIKKLISLSKFDGYSIPHGDNEFDLGLTTHVVEHVEHERMFLKEAARVCKKLYVEVPLEHTISLDKTISISRPLGHINFYTKKSFDNLIRTSGLTIEKSIIFPASLEREIFIANSQLIGFIKNKIRTNALKIAPNIATHVFVYMYGVICHI